MIAVADLLIAEPLYAFLVEEALPGSGVDTERFFIGLSELMHRFGPRNTELLETRDRMQRAIDEWHVAHRDGLRDEAAYRAFLEDLGYIVPAGPKFSLTTENVDVEIALVAGPQLVVPVSNGRYALNAANARWGSLYDAVYGTDVLGAPPHAGPYDPARGAGASPSRRGGPACDGFACGLSTLCSGGRRARGHARRRSYYEPP